MKQIVFFIGSFLVLLQLHSTTVTADSQTGWDRIEFKILFYTDAMKHRWEKLKEFGESAWKEANVKAPKKWAAFLVPSIKYMDTLKENFSKYIGELRKTVPLEWEEIEPKVLDLVDGIILKLKELAKEVTHAASGTRQEINASVSRAIKELTKLMDTKPVDTENILQEAVQKKLNAKQIADGQKSQKNV